MLRAFHLPYLMKMSCEYVPSSQRVLEVFHGHLRVLDCLVASHQSRLVFRILECRNRPLKYENHVRAVESSLESSSARQPARKWFMHKYNLCLFQRRRYRCELKAPKFTLTSNPTPFYQYNRNVVTSQFENSIVDTPLV